MRGKSRFDLSKRTCEEFAVNAGLTDESVCPTLMRKRLTFCGAGAFACQPVLSQLLTRAAPIRAATVRERSPANRRAHFRNGVLSCRSPGKSSAHIEIW